jgi:hypothetical protein
MLVTYLDINYLFNYSDVGTHVVIGSKIRFLLIVWTINTTFPLKSDSFIGFVFMYHVISINSGAFFNFISVRISYLIL